MEKFILTEAVNLYKDENSTRRSCLLDINEEYLLDENDTSVPEGRYDDSHRVPIYTEGNDVIGQIGWVNFNDFMKVALEYKNPSELVENEVIEEVSNEETVEEEPVAEIKELKTRGKLIKRVMYDSRGYEVPEWFNSVILEIKDYQDNLVTASYGSRSFVFNKSLINENI